MPSGNDLAKLIISSTWSPIVFKKNYRDGTNFISSELCTIDVDKGYPIKQAEILLRKINAKYILATTKSHGIEKRSGKIIHPPCDRYRIIMFFKEKITDLNTYIYNVNKYIKIFKADSCGDGARYFFPCKAVHSFRDGLPLPVFTYKDMKGFVRSKRKKKEIECKILPFWCDNFLKSGQLIRSGSRHTTIYSVARTLAEYGISVNDAETRIMSAPFDRVSGRKIEDKEIERTVRDAYKKSRDG